MKRVFVLSILCIGIMSLMHAQKTDQSVLASAGNFDKVSTISIEWTLGEMAGQTHVNSDVILTEGFHQSWLQVEEIMTSQQTLWVEQMEVSVFPNPTPAELHIKIDSGLEEKGVLSLKNLEGRSLQSETINLSSGNHQWNMINYPAGLYVLTLHTQKGELLKSFKITKTH